MFPKHISILFPVLIWVLLHSVTGTPSGGDFVFPVLNELAIGDPCTIQPAPGLNGVSYAREGICQRVRDCATFIPRIIRESFDVRRDICYFEVHDPVVCCVNLAVPSALEELDDSNLIK